MVSRIGVNHGGEGLYMNWAELGQKILIAVYTFALVMVCLYGFHRYVLVYLYYRHR